MSNIKRVEIRATVPFNFLNKDRILAADLGRIATNPYYGLKIYVEPHEGKPDRDGGKEILIQLTITGKEAISWPALKSLTTRIKKHSGLDRLLAIAYDAEQLIGKSTEINILDVDP